MTTDLASGLLAPAGEVAFSKNKFKVLGFAICGSIAAMMLVAGSVGLWNAGLVVPRVMWGRHRGIVSLSAETQHTDIFVPHPAAQATVAHAFADCCASCAAMLTQTSQASSPRRLLAAKHGGPSKNLLEEKAMVQRPRALPILSQARQRFSNRAAASAEHTALFSKPMTAGTENIHHTVMGDSCNRYQCKDLAAIEGDKTNWLLKCEVELAKYFDQRFGLGVNSGGAAIMLGLKAMHQVLLNNAERVVVYSNSFTFNAVPSAIVNAGFSPTFIGTSSLLTIDLDDLERQVQEDLASGVTPGNMILVLSYMRGRVPDMDRVLELCSKYQILLLEDNAHGYGVEWKGRKLGSFGDVSAISTQSNKLINTGEGGFVFTSNDHMQAFFMFSAGCYEELFKKHEVMCPSAEAIEDLRFSVCNWSCRLSNIQAALAYPQIAALPSRIEAHNSNYYKLREAVFSKLDASLKSAVFMGSLQGERNPWKLIEFIPQLPDICPVYDSLQMRMKLPPQEIASFVSLMNAKGFKVQSFNDMMNARYYRSWKYCVSEDEHFESTDAVLEGVVDMRLLAHDTAEDIENQAEAIKTCFLQAAHIVVQESAPADAADSRPLNSVFSGSDRGASVGAR
eukprot:gnl/TRDRNA2_/TRDRNA2_176784_c0_seq1.p1 gnl/TRDRNA2_/TRDRNA2_176784_c0~~gnl/TRDRNA2_/TRDRNA2_176784_c0_seq1.p1  ORF type:complete len:621 (+),score=91.73 gnl/TRDRNA2_/TRDRNA2_176784_c0_seq1:106-1968(+)